MVKMNWGWSQEEKQKVAEINAKEVHGNKYKYGEFIAVHATWDIYCKKCKKWFKQTYANHTHKSHPQNCPDCGKETKRIKKTHTQQEIEELFTNIHGDAYKPYGEYNGYNSHMTATCNHLEHPHGTIIITPENHIYRGDGCVRCGHISVAKQLTHKRKQFLSNLFKKHPGIKNYIDFSEFVYINNHTKAMAICKKCDWKWDVIPNSLLQGCGCPNCKTSKGVKKIKYWLEQNEISFKTEKRFLDCKNVRPLPFDFYIPKYNLCIEYDGIQHFKPVSIFGGLKGLLQNQQHDEIKTKYCTGIDEKPILLRISYLDFENILNILDNYFRRYK